MSPTPPYIDPIAHAWALCNPHAQLPSALVARAAPARFSVYLSDDQLLIERSGATRDIQYSLLSVATLPRIPPSIESVRDESIAEPDPRQGTVPAPQDADDG